MPIPYDPFLEGIDYSLEQLAQGIVDSFGGIYKRIAPLTKKGATLLFTIPLKNFKVKIKSLETTDG